MVVTLAIPLRAAFGLQDFITTQHLDNMAKVMLATGLIVAYGYLMEAFMAWYSQNPYEEFVQLMNRPFGPYAHTYWMMILCNVLHPSAPLVPLGPDAASSVSGSSAIFVNIGMWLERYVIVVTSLHRDFIPSSWSMYHGTFWDYATYYGTIGLFVSLLFLFIRFLPVISITEMRELVHETQQEEHGHAAFGAADLRGERAMKVAHGSGRPLWPDGGVRTTRGRGRGDPACLRARLPDDGGVLALPGRWAGRGAGVPARIGSRLVVLIGGIIGRTDRVLHAVVSRPSLSYPIDVGGRPLNSWPAFIPITFEMTILFAALSAVFGMLGLNGLPRPHHPVFNVPDFVLASRNRFFLCLQARDPLFDRGRVPTIPREVQTEVHQRRPILTRNGRFEGRVTPG